MKFLVADDNKFMRNVLANELKKLGHEVIGEALNGKEAEELYFSLKPDVVTMDITMPEVDGIEAAKAIIARDPQAKIIMLTGMGHKDYSLETKEIGVVDFLPKPVNFDRLRQTIENLK